MQLFHSLSFLYTKKHRNKSRFVLCFFVFLTFLQNVDGQVITKLDGTVVTTEEIDKILTDLSDSAGMVGFSVAVVQNDAIVYNKAFGLKNKQTLEKADENTIFEGASLTKPLVAYLALLLAVEGKFNLDKPLYQYLQNRDLWYDYRYLKITARMILSHSSGLPNWRDYRGLRIGFAPGTGYSYSSEGFIYLQRVLEKVTGKKLGDLMNEKIFQVLGMNNSSLVWRSDYDSRYADRHDSTGKAWGRFKATEASAAGTLYTNAEDYARFIRFLFQNKSLTDKLMAPQIKVKMPTSFSQNLWWGLGFGLQEYEKGLYFFHWGDNIYSKAYFAGSVEQKTALIFFSNQENGLKIRDKLMERLMGLSDHPTTDMLNFPQF